jgi:Tfp pilus assembly protein PilN
MKAVNLLPATQGVGASLSDRRSRVLVIGAVVAVGAMGWWGYSASQSADSVAAQLDQAQVQKAALDQQIAALGVYSQRQQAVAARQGTVVQLASSRVDWERLVRNVVTVLPSGVWVNTINGSLPTTNAAAAPAATAPGTVGQPNASAPQGLHIVGDAFTQGQVADLLARLAAVPGLGEPRLASAQATVTSGKSIVGFTIDVPIDPSAQDVATLTAVGPGASVSTGVVAQRRTP